MIMQKEDFVKRMLYQQHLRKTKKKLLENEIEAYASDSKRKKYKHRINHSTKKK